MTDSETIPKPIEVPRELVESIVAPYDAYLPAGVLDPSVRYLYGVFSETGSPQVLIDFIAHSAELINMNARPGESEENSMRLARILAVLADMPGMTSAPQRVEIWEKFFDTKGLVGKTSHGMLSAAVAHVRDSSDVFGIKVKEVTRESLKRKLVEIGVIMSGIEGRQVVVDIRDFDFLYAMDLVDIAKKLELPDLTFLVDDAMVLHDALRDLGEN